MYRNYDVIEVTKENEYKYLDSIVQLEETVLNQMNKDGKIGQLFTTGREDLSEYINSKSNHVLIAVRNNDKIISAAYITEGQTPFTYNDITKYFKCDENYQEYIKSKYDRCEYPKTIRDIYIKKLCAYRYARDVILKEIYDINKLEEQEKNEIFLKMIEDEYNDPQNNFHEKSEIRDNFNKNMSSYMKFVKNDIERYQEFYWIDFDYLKHELENEQENENKKKVKKVKTPDSIAVDSDIETYDKILQYQKYKIYDKTQCSDMSKYYNANTDNTIEIDTYITHPNDREKGIARILVLEGLKKSLNEQLKNKNNKEVFLVSTLHQENLSSKYVSEFFGLKDYIFVNRRNGRDRQVHIYGMNRKEIPEYISKMEKKVAVLYGYNPNNIQISNNEKNEIIKEQIKYEVAELQRLEKIRDVYEKKKYTGYIKGKRSKIEELQESLYKIEEGRCLDKDSEKEI